MSKLWELVMDREAWHTAVHGGRKELDTTQTELNRMELKCRHIKAYNTVRLQAELAWLAKLCMHTCT